MVLCELAAGHDLSPVALWLVLTALGLLSILPASGAVFYAQYVRRSYAQWRWKTLPAYPSAADVRLERRKGVALRVDNVEVKVRPHLLSSPTPPGGTTTVSAVTRMEGRVAT